MSDKLRVFVSSVQRELANERIAVLELITTIDPFLAAHCDPVLYEFEPASPDKALDGCLKSVASCHIFMLLVWRAYGRKERWLSITHHEYRHAKQLDLPILVYIKGPAAPERVALYSPQPRSGAQPFRPRCLSSCEVIRAQNLDILPVPGDSPVRDSITWAAHR